MIGWTSEKNDGKAIDLARGCFDQFNFVAVRVLDERNDGRSMFHRSRFTSYFATLGLDPIARCLGIVYA